MSFLTCSKRADNLIGDNSGSGNSTIEQPIKKWVGVSAITFGIPILATNDLELSIALIRANKIVKRSKLRNYSPIA